MLPERRSSSRIRAYRPLRLQVPKTHRVVETLTKDLGMGGICCISSTLFPVLTELTVELTLSTGREPLSIRGKTVWFRMIPHSEQFDLGIAFQEMPAEDKRRLSAYLDHLVSQSPSVQV